MKEWFPRMCEALVVEDIKEPILSSSSKFQIGGQPGMRPQFHLFVIKSLMALREKKDQGAIFSVVDIVKFFDKESLSDATFTLYNNHVDPKAVRLWWKLNSRTNITVLTGSGKSEQAEAGAVLGQGSSGAALVSQKNLDQGTEDYFAGSTDEDVYGGTRLQPLTFVDDVLRSAVGVLETRAGNVKLGALLNDKCLTAHPIKSAYLVVGSKKFKDQVDDETKDDPIMLNNDRMKRKRVVTYLGDELHEDGLVASIGATIK